MRRRYRHEAKAFCRYIANDPEVYDEAPAPVAIDTYRQGRALSAKEGAFYKRLTSYQRTKANEDLVIDRVVRKDRRSVPPALLPTKAA